MLRMDGYFTGVRPHGRCLDVFGKGGHLSPPQADAIGVCI